MIQTRRGFTLLETLTAIVIVAVIVAIAMPVTLRLRESARKSACSNNLREIAQAAISHDSSRGALPDLYNGSFLKKPPSLFDEFHYHSWRTQLLPLLDQTPLYGSISFSIAATDAGNQRYVNTPIPVFVCPSTSNPTRVVRDISQHRYMPPKFDGKPTGTVTVTAARNDYEAIGGVAFKSYGTKDLDVVKMGAWGEPLKYDLPNPMEYRKARLADITDGQSNTILIGERAGRPDLYIKGEPVRINPINDPRGGFDYHQAAWAISTHFWWLVFSHKHGVNQSNGGLFSFHSSGANVALADGSVHFLSDGTDQELLNALVTRASSEQLTLEKALR